MLKNFRSVDFIMLALAFACLIFAKIMWFRGENEGAVFVGLWVPTILGFAMYLETAIVNYGITELVKVLAKRTRPYAYNKQLDNGIKIKRDTRKSFFSGHTSHVAASSFFTAKVLSDMHPGDSQAFYWITAATIPAVTAYLRVKGGKHFPTDVLIGYAVGALVGILVPGLHKL